MMLGQDELDAPTRPPETLLTRRDIETAGKALELFDKHDKALRDVKNTSVASCAEQLRTAMLLDAEMRVCLRDAAIQLLTDRRTNSLRALEALGVKP